MKVGLARNLATEWIMENASREKEFLGAYFSGSTVGMPDDAELPASSDVDIVVVTASEEPPLKLGKFSYKDVLLEITYISQNQLSSAEKVLETYYLAGSFRVNTIITDPNGWLTKLQSEVSRHFAEASWVRRRRDNVLKKIENGIVNMDTSAPYHDLVTSWLFPTGVTTHAILVAALENPTVRLRYLRVREVLVEYGYENFYFELLELLGCIDLDLRRVEKHLLNLSKTFDAAVAVAKTPFFFSSDITTAARPIAIDGGRDLIQSGDHREAIFWMGATFARCHKILAVDGTPDIQSTLMPAFEDFVADLGITSRQDFIDRGQDVLRFLPRLWRITEDILFKNTDIIIAR